MSDVAYASQGLASETICCDGFEIIESFEFGSGKPFAQNWEIIFLHGRMKSEVLIHSRTCHIRGDRTNFDAMTVICNLQQFQTAVLDEDFD